MIIQRQNLGQLPFSSAISLLKEVPTTSPTQMLSMPGPKESCKMGVWSIRDINGHNPVLPVVTISLSRTEGFNFFSYCQTYKIIHRLDCIQFSNYFRYKNNPLRSRSLILPFCSFQFINVSHIWNRLPDHIIT